MKKSIQQLGCRSHLGKEAGAVGLFGQIVKPRALLSGRFVPDIIA